MKNYGVGVKVKRKEIVSCLETEGVSKLQMQKEAANFRLIKKGYCEAKILKREF